MKTRTKIATIAFFVPYLIWAFTSLDVNPANWAEIERFIVATAGMGCAFIAAIGMSIYEAGKP
jgi:hypothetical protein